MTDVPVQYKKAVDKNVNLIMGACEDLIAIAEELGSDNVRLYHDEIVVEIKQNKKRKGRLEWLRRLMRKMMMRR